jgi:hypothetical protein
MTWPFPTNLSNLIPCGTCGYPLAPEERTTLVEQNGVMVKPTEFNPDNYEDAPV